MFVVQYLADKRKEYQPSARRAVIGRKWVTVSAPVKRYVVAERTLQRVRTDMPDAFCRIHPVNVR